MTKDELKRKLKSAAYWQKSLEQDYVELQKLRDNAARVTPQYSEAPSSCGDGQKLESIVISIADYEAIIKAHMDYLYQALDEVSRLINLVDDPQAHLVLQMRYRSFKKWEQIAAETNYSIAHIHRIHGMALSEIIQKTRTSNNLDKKIVTK